LYPFVLQGQSIDRSLYDVLNSYTDEMGSDGVVRTAAANMNYGLVRLRQEVGNELKVVSSQRSPAAALAILPGLAHSGEEMGIIRSVTLKDAAKHPTVKALVRCLEVGSAKDYETVTAEFQKLSAKTQRDEETQRTKIGPFSRTFKTHRCMMLVFTFRDDEGYPVTDFDMRLTAGKNYDEYALPPGFFIDRQRNSRDPSTLTYYLDYDVMIAGLDKKLENRLGFVVEARPATGLSHYDPAIFRGTSDDIVKALLPNETLLIEITLKRNIDRQIFTLTDNLTAPEDISGTPSGTSVS
jgi:hypothetical protein